MKEKLEKLRQQAILEINLTETKEDLFEIEKKYLGRNGGELNEILKGLVALPNEEKPTIGKLSNEIKTEILSKIEKKKIQLEEDFYKILTELEFLDVTQPSIGRKKIGSRHLISSFIDYSVDVFSRMGFDLADGPEVETEWYNFTALNLDADHPAREMQDTFFVKDLQGEKHKQATDERDSGFVLRTQTSSIQLHYLEKYGAPCAVIGPGRVFRRDSDATHSPMFFQIEGLFVNKKVSIAHLKLVLLKAFREILEDDSIEMRFRLSYFPFTEPSFEVDVSCPICGGKEKICKVCKGNNWLEIGGAGMVHPNVLKNAGVDPEEFNGFAFGFGIDRLSMIKHKVNDIRLFYENDLRFLKQF